VSRESLRMAATLAALGIVEATPLMAAEGVAQEAAHHHEEHAPSVTELLFPAINFALFSVILVKYVIPAMREYLQRRAQDITKTIAESAAALADAEAEMSAARARSNSVASERESIRRDLVESATRQAERLRGQAEDTGKRRLADAALVAEQERRRAIQDVRAEVAALATELAESRLRAALSPDDQRVFVQQFLKDAPTR
jgi:F-type H+-transporting ATPase subunit b